MSEVGTSESDSRDYSMIARLSVIAALLCSNGSDPGQDGQPAPPTMTLGEALDYAMSHSPLLAAARDQVFQRQDAAQIPRSRWLPLLGASAQFFAATDNNTTAVTTLSPSVMIPRIGGRAYNSDLTFDNAASWHPYASSFIGVGITQQIFDFGVTAAQIASADALTLAGRHDLEVSRLDIQLAVTVAFTAVQAAHAVVSAADAAVLRASAHRDQASALVQSELRSRIFLERAQAELSRLRVGALRAKAGLVVAESGLANTAGFDQPLLDVRGPPWEPAPMPNREEAIATALANDPQIQSLRAQLESQREAANAIADLARPNLLLTSTLSARSGGAPVAGVPPPQFGGYLPETPNWDVGIVANWTFFDPTVFSNARAAHAQERVVSDRLLNAQQLTRAAAMDAWVRTQQSTLALPELLRAFSAAKENYEQANVRFNEGLGTSVEIADAESLLTDAEVQLAVGRFEESRARAELDRAMAGGH
jgi:outer membrane protein